MLFTELCRDCRSDEGVRPVHENPGGKQDSDVPIEAGIVDWDTAASYLDDKTRCMICTYMSIARRYLYTKS